MRVDKHIRSAIGATCAAALLTFAFSGCELVNTQETAAPRLPAASGGGEGSTGEATFSGSVGPMLQKYCSECHNASSASGGVVLTSFDALHEKPGLIVPGDADASLLVEELESGGMPPAGRPRPGKAEIKAVRDWIAAGAVDN